jgi:hypothetical protein
LINQALSQRFGLEPSIAPHEQRRTTSTDMHIALADFLHGFGERPQYGGFVHGRLGQIVEAWTISFNGRLDRVGSQRYGPGLVISTIDPTCVASCVAHHKHKAPRGRRGRRQPFAKPFNHSCTTVYQEGNIGAERLRQAT